MVGEKNPARGRRARVRVILVAASVVAVAALWSSFGGTTARTEEAAAATAATDPRTLVIGVSSDPQTLDPEFGQATRANETLKNIYAQWVRYPPLNPNQDVTKADVSRVVPEAFKSWKVAKNGTITFSLRPGAKFPSGRSITADDFVYKVNRALAVKFGSVFVFNILGITKPGQVKKINATTFQIKLPAGSPILGPMMRDQDAGIVDTALVKKNSTATDPWGTKWLARTGGAASGAYVIGEYVPGTKMTLKANPNYWGPKPYFTTVVLQVIPSSQNRVLLLRKGSIDIAEDLSVEDAVRLKGQSGVKVVSFPTVSQNLLGFVADKKPFNDVRVRQAIAYAIPYQQLVDGPLRGQAKVAKGVWPQNSIWFQKAPYPYKLDTKKAKALLAQAGYAGGLTFTVEISDGDADAQALAIPLKTALADVGVTMNIAKLSAAQFQKNRSERSPQAWIGSNLGSFVDDPYYHSFLWLGTNSVINWFKYSNPFIDSSQKKFAKVLSVAQRRALARQVQVQLNKDLPFISLGEPNYLLPVRQDIKGIVYEPDGLVTYRYLKRK
jgi:peptide/nickel transport system substrate-binding protein